MKCLWCSKELVKLQTKFCSKKCQHKFTHQEYIIRWKEGKETGLSGDNISKHIRKYLFEKYNSKCVECGWSEINSTTGKIPLTVEHVDGNYKNNTEDNLKLICPNCHSLTSTYGSLNRGNGRPKRMTIYRTVNGEIHSKNEKKEISFDECPICGNKKPIKQKTCSYNCAGLLKRKKNRPSKKELQQLIFNNSWVAIGKMYDVSDNTIRKWAKAYDLNIKKERPERMYDECPICKKEKISTQKFCSQECVHVQQRKVERPSKEVLQQLINENNYSKIGRMYNVSHNAVRKWAKTYEII